MKAIILIGVVLLLSGCNTYQNFHNPGPPNPEICAEIFEKYDMNAIHESGTLEGGWEIWGNYSDEFNELLDNDCTVKMNKNGTEVYYKDHLVKSYEYTRSESEEYSYFPTRLGEEKLLTEKDCCGHYQPGE